ncbi:MAG TPA: DUF503 domain-containing protein [Clostridiaceae bacterium]|jgi:uncharacterized protein YlxP (DUF503 family)|nr:DUF503 domain-containing protein [Clostridiaceae bacterium]
MRVLIVEVVIHLPWSTSLKDKRKVRYGLIDRLTRRHRISVKEVDCQDAQQTLCLGIAGVVLSEAGGRELEQSILNTIENHCEGEIRDWNAEII